MEKVITFLGTGTSQGIPVIGCTCPVCQSSDFRDKRLRSSILITLNNKRIVIDCGPDFRQQMLRSGTASLDAILLTHEHNDHIIGIDDVRPFNFMSKRDMPVYATPRVANELTVRFPYIFSANQYPGAPKVKLLEISKEGPFEVLGNSVIPIEVMHGRLPVLGFRIENFTYITDISAISESEKLKVKGTHTLVLSALHRKPHHSHLNLEQALRLIDEIAPNQAYLTHISHSMGFHEEVSAELPPNVALAYDGLTISVI